MERKMIVRKYKETDCRETAALFYETVHNVNRRDYSRRQCEAWAPEKRNLTAWNERFLRHFSFVAVEDGKIIGFGDIDDDGYLDRLAGSGLGPLPGTGKCRFFCPYSHSCFNHRPSVF